jgi:hypothetical protein
MFYLYSVYTDAAKIALQSILAHNCGAFLTLIGIIIAGGSGGGRGGIGQRP